MAATLYIPTSHTVLPVPCPLRTSFLRRVEGPVSSPTAGVLGPSFSVLCECAQESTERQAKARGAGTITNASASLHSFYTHGMCANLASTSSLHEGTSLSEAFCFPNWKQLLSSAAQRLKQEELPMFREILLHHGKEDMPRMTQLRLSSGQALKNSPYISSCVFKFSKLPTW